jgi:hypothetical protein
MLLKWKRDYSRWNFDEQRRATLTTASSLLVQVVGVVSREHSFGFPGRTCKKVLAKSNST